MVADRFPKHTLAQCAFKVFAVQTAQRNLLRRVQARFQPAVCGNADAVAVGAEKRWLIGRIRPIFPFQPGI